MQPGTEELAADVTRALGLRLGAVHFTRGELLMLQVLLQHQEVAISKKGLMLALYGDRSMSAKNVDFNLHMIRRKLENSSSWRIQTLTGGGYLAVPPPSALPTQPA